jgi:hypothetical protein
MRRQLQPLCGAVCPLLLFRVAHLSEQKPIVFEPAPLLPIRSLFVKPWSWVFGRKSPQTHVDKPVLDLGVIMSRQCIIKVLEADLP